MPKLHSVPVGYCRSRPGQVPESPQLPFVAKKLQRKLSRLISKWSFSHSLQEATAHCLYAASVINISFNKSLQVHVMNWNLKSLIWGFKLCKMCLFSSFLQKHNSCSWLQCRLEGNVMTQQLNVHQSSVRWFHILEQGANHSLAQCVQLSIRGSSQWWILVPQVDQPCCCNTHLCCASF